MRFKLTLLLLVAMVVGCMGEKSKKQTAGHSQAGGGVDDSRDSDPLLVYCAAGIRLPVADVAKQYESEFGRQVQIDYGSSGELEGRLEIDRRSGKSRCDLYIPADTSFAERAQKKSLTVESMLLAQFRLVLAMKPDAATEYRDVDELIASGDQFVVCDPQAGVGKKTMTALQTFGKWDTVDKAKKVSFPRVPEAANAIKTASDIAAGFIWDTTAKQFGLRSVVLKEIENAVSSVTVNVVASTKRPTQAIHFARYLAAKDKGQQAFSKYGFVPIGTDSWQDKPEIVLYCGGVNRNAIEKTLREFELREGIKINEQYGGCGTLVTGINSAANGENKKAMPDAFMTCDVSYMDKVQTYFDLPSDVSSTDVVVLVRKGNPKQIRTIKDLAQPGLSVGTTNPKMSTLGDISWQLFDAYDVRALMEQQQNVAVMTPTAHELILQMTGHDKLDAALVYEANCQNLSDGFEIVRIDDERALAVQNIAVAKVSPFPALTARLIAAVKSSTSQKRFELQGFQWRVQPASNQ